MQLTNAQSRMENSLGLYQDLLTRVDKDFKTLEQIELDIHRTFPDNKFFKDGKQERKKLYNVLVAFAGFFLLVNLNRPPFKNTTSASVIAKG